MTLTETIQTALIGAKYPGDEEVERILSDILGETVIHYDTVVADGADDDEPEDTRILRACFHNYSMNVIVNVFYGDVTREIGFVDVMEPAV